MACCIAGRGWNELLGYVEAVQIAMTGTISRTTIR
jgi:hypothetical protein